MHVYAITNNLKNPFTINNAAVGRDWLEGFFRRYPGISLRKPEATGINRLTAFNRAEMTLFYKNFECVMEKFKFPATRIFNADETATVQRQNEIYAETGQKRIGCITCWAEGKTTTAMCAFSASCVYVPKMFHLFKQKKKNCATS